MNSASIVFIIPTYNRIELLKKLLLDLSILSRNAPYSIRIIVVNDGSTDNTSNLIKMYYPEIIIIEGSGDWWFTKSINKGLEIALTLNTEYIFTLNDDIRFPKNFGDMLNSVLPLRKNTIIKCAEKDIYTGNYTFLGGDIDLKYENSKYYVDLYKDTVLEKLESTFGHTRGLLFPKRLIEEIGLLDIRFKQYFGDVDFVLQAQKKGYKVIVYPELYINSYIELTGSTKFENTRNLLNSIRRLFQKTSPSYIPSIVLFNYKNAKPGFFIIRCTINLVKVVFGYYIRWMTNELPRGRAHEVSKQR
jgi:GT2 family glycosyltransferase